MKLHNPFIAKNDDIKLSAGMSIFIVFGFFLGGLTSKVGFLAAVSILLTICAFVVLLVPLYCTIKYIFTGKE